MTISLSRGTMRGCKKRKRIQTHSLGSPFEHENPCEGIKSGRDYAGRTSSTTLSRETPQKQSRSETPDSMGEMWRCYRKATQILSAVDVHTGVGIQGKPDASQFSAETLFQQVLIVLVALLHPIQVVQELLGRQGVCLVGCARRRRRG